MSFHSSRLDTMAGGEVYSRPRSYRISWKWRSSATFHVNGRRRCLFLIPVYQVFPSRPRDRGKGKTRSVPWERGSRRGRPRTKPSRGGTSRFGSKCDRSIRAIIDERLAEEKRGGGRKKREEKNLRVFESSESRRRARNVYVHEKIEYRNGDSKCHERYWRDKGCNGSLDRTGEDDPRSRTREQCHVGSRRNIPVAVGAWNVGGQERALGKRFLLSLSLSR